MMATLSLVPHAQSPGFEGYCVLTEAMVSNLARVNEVERRLRALGYPVDRRDVNALRVHFKYDPHVHSLSALYRIAQSHRWVPVPGSNTRRVGVAMVEGVVVEWEGL